MTVRRRENVLSKYNRNTPAGVYAQDMVKLMWKEITGILNLNIEIRKSAHRYCPIK